MTKQAWVMMVVVGLWLTMGSGAVQAQELEPVSAQAQQELVEQAVRPFVGALQTGDVERLEQLIGGRLARTLGKLLRQNPAYPGFLRQRYGGTTIQEPIEIRQHRSGTGPASGPTAGPRLATVQLQRAGGGPEQFLLTLEPDPQGIWKIIDKVQQR